MFRQTLIRGAKKRGLEAGATNSAVERHRVDFTLRGDNNKIEELITILKSGKPINSWGAKVTSLIENTSGIPLNEHEVTTTNVDNFKWKKGVEMYL
jgi:acylphosphatase